jgi:hypothetical protein
MLHPCTQHHQSAGVAAAMATVNGVVPDNGGVGAINVTALQARLRFLGQVLEPRGAQPTPPAPPSLSGDEWYAWKNMWSVQPADGSQE